MGKSFDLNIWKTEVSFTEMKTVGRINFGEDQKFGYGHTTFEMLVRQLCGDVWKAEWI